MNARAGKADEEWFPAPPTEQSTSSKGSAQGGVAPAQSGLAGRVKKKGGENMAKAQPKAKAASKASVDPMSTVNPKYRGRVVKVAQTNPRGKATRVVIRCESDGCSNTREIATQDLFQVKFCSEHAGSRKSAAKAASKAKAGKSSGKAATKTAARPAAKSSKPSSKQRARDRVAQLPAEGSADEEGGEEE